MSVRGIEIRVDWSLAVVFWLIAFNLGAGLFPRAHPDWSPLMNWSLALAAAVLFFLSILAHELAHALVGRRHGMIIDGITLFMFGGVAHLRGEPRSATAEFVTAVVGPLTSLVIGALATGLGAMLAPLGASSTGVPFGVEGTTATGMASRLGPLATVLLWLGPVNVILAIFNLIPGFPLDGGRVLRAALWGATGDLGKATRWASGVGRAVALLFVAAGILLLFGAVPALGGGVVQGLWLIFIGWFLHAAAMRSQRQVVLREALQNVSVARLMRPEPITVPRSLSLSALAERLLSAPEQGCFPVTEDGKLLGVVGLQDLRRVPREEWDRHTVQEIMTPAPAVPVIDTEEDMSAALEKLGHAPLDQLPVVREGRVTGLLRMADIMRWIELAPAAGR